MVPKKVFLYRPMMHTDPPPLMISLVEVSSCVARSRVSKLLWPNSTNYSSYFSPKKWIFFFLQKPLEALSNSNGMFGDGECDGVFCLWAHSVASLTHSNSQRLIKAGAMVRNEYAAISVRVAFIMFLHIFSYSVKFIYLFVC